MSHAILQLNMAQAIVGAALARLHICPALTTLKLMPYPQNHQYALMRRMADQVLAESEVADRFRIRCLHDATAHFRERAQVFDASDRVGCHASRCSWIIACDEGTEANQVSNRFLRVNQPHLPAFGGDSSPDSPHDSSQA